MKLHMISVAAVVGLSVLAGAAHAAGPGRGLDFETMDANGDGRVTVAELEAMRETRFATLDADGDGTVTRDEFVAAASDRAGSRAGEMFDRLDADGDGVLSRDAVEASRRGPAPERLVARLDTDGDGAVSETEFEAAKARMMERRGGHGGRAPAR